MEELEELKKKISEKERIARQYEKNAETFINNHFKSASWMSRNHLKKAYLLIVRDKILF